MARRDAKTPQTRLTVQQVAAQLGISRQSVTRLIEAGELPAVNMATKPDAVLALWRIDPKDLARFERQRTN